MTYYGRLSDIVSYRIDDLLEQSPDRTTAIARIIAEIEEGLAGAKRSVGGAEKSLEKLRAELAERQAQAEDWGQIARKELTAGNEEAARQALFRKRETADLAAGIEQQVAAAVSTHSHLTTILRAVEARLAEARRLQQDLLASAGEVPAKPKKRDSSYGRPREGGGVDPARQKDVEDDLDALRRELGQG
ncbi:MAG: PspA/IM30 family protein [Planctomycetota bacterium]|nr:PspA/IM30 family protein [Planctomycetota bacterium]